MSTRNIVEIEPDTGKSFSEALILASTNPRYDKILFTTSVEHVVYINFHVLTS